MSKDAMNTAIAATKRDLILAGPLGSLDAYIQAAGSVPFPDRGRGAGAGDPPARKMAIWTPRVNWLWRICASWCT